MRSAQYVLVQPREGNVHAVSLRGIPGSAPLCGCVVGPRWLYVRTYRSRSITRKRVTCAKCKSALSSVNPIRRNGNE